MPYITVEVSPELSKRINLWGSLGDETPEELTLRLLEEYVDDCEVAERISAEVEAGTMKTYPYEQVKRNLELAN